VFLIHQTLDPPLSAATRLSKNGKVLITVPNGLYYGHRGYKQVRDTPKFEGTEAFVDGQEDNFKDASKSLKHRPITPFLAPDKFVRGSKNLEKRGVNVWGASDPLGEVVGSIGSAMGVAGAREKRADGGRGKGQGRPAPAS